MTAKLIVSVKEVNGIAQVVYYCKERRRIYRKSFADTVREFRDAYRKANKKQVATGEGYAAGLRPAAPLPGGRGGCTPTCRANTVTNIKVDVNIIKLPSRSLSAIRPMTVTEYNSIHADNYKTEKNTRNIILIMIVATICLIKVIRAAKKSN